jgi:hypothetical protein
MSTDLVRRRSTRSTRPLDAGAIDHLCDLDADAWWHHDQRPYPLANDSNAPRPIRFEWTPPGHPPYPYKVNAR